MSDQEDNITPFRLPVDAPSDSSETFAERLRRRRNEIGSGSGDVEVHSTWQSRNRMLFALVAESPHASASLMRKSADKARALAGVEAILFAEDLPPFQNSLGKDFSDEPLLAEDSVFYRGQPVAIVVAVDEATCRLALQSLEIEYHSAPGILTLEHALAMESFHPDPRVCQRGDSRAEISRAEMTCEGNFLIAPQEACLDRTAEITIRPIAGGTEYSVHVEAQRPTAVRTAVASAANIPESNVRLEPVPLSGVTDALELEPVRLAALATHASLKCGAGVTLSLSSPHSPLSRGQRHEAQSKFEVGFNKAGQINALDLQIALDGGWFAADSAAMLDRALLHADSVYRIPNLHLGARLCRTNHLTSSSLPAEGAAQGAWMMEEVISKVAEATGLSTREIREKNFYLEDDEIKTTPYGQPINPVAITRVWNQVLLRSDFDNRREQIAKWNRENPHYKRGIAITPAKFGLGDPRPERNAAAVILQILADGSVVLRAGLVGVSDGLEDQLREEVALRLGVEDSDIRVVLNDFEALPRSTPVLGTDAAGLAIRAIGEACDRLSTRLREVALQLFAARGQTNIELEAIRFSRGLVGNNIAPKDPLLFKEVVDGAWKKRVNLIETGYHRTPNLWWDPELGAGWPFSAFTYAAAVTEIQVDALTGEIQILRADIAHEGSPSPDQGDRDYAQLMRAFTLGAGWVLTEEAPAADAEDGEDFSFEEGVFGFADAPFEVVSDRLRPLGDPSAVPGDPCAEAPVLLAASIREALWEAMRAFGYEASLEVALPLPATPPRIIATCKEISRQLRKRAEKKA